MQIVFKNTWLYILCALFVLPNLAHAKESVLDIKPFTTESGISVWLVEDHSVPIISIDFAFQNAGSAHDPADKQGLARLTSNTLDEGAGDLDSQAFQKELRDLSISLSFNAGRDHFGGSVKTLSSNSARAFTLLKLAITEPRLEQEPLERMRNANQARIRSSLSDPGWMSARLLNDIAFAGHPYAQNSGGTLSSLEAITSDDIRNFITTHFARDTLRVGVAGDITQDELSVIIDDIFGALPKEAQSPALADLTLQNSGTLALFERSDIPQTNIEIMQPGIARKDEAYHHAQIMNFILGSSGFGSRLTQEIREKRGLTYGIYSSLYSLDHFNGLMISTSTAHKNVKTMLQLIHDEWSKMRSYPVSEDELKNAKSYLTGSLPLSLTSTDKISGLLLSLMMDDLGPDYLDKRSEAIRSAKIDDIFAISQTLLDPETFVTVLVGAPEKIDVTKTIEVLPNVE